MSRSWLNIGITALALAGVGCSGFINNRAAQSTYAVMEGSRVAMKRASDVELARAAAPGGLVQLEAFHLAYPAHRGFVAMLAEGYCQYAAGFVNTDWERSVLSGDTDAARKHKRRALSLLARCVDYGLTMLGPRWRTAYEERPKDLLDLTTRATKSDVLGMKWLALGMVNALAVDPFNPGRLGSIPMMRRLLLRITELDEAHDDATALLMLGALDSARPRIIGGDPVAGKRFLDRARQLTGGGSLMVHVVLARTYAVATNNRALFRTSLQHVLDADLDKWPERRLANEMAREKARMYLDAETKIFGGAAVASDSAPTEGRTASGVSP